MPSSQNEIEVSNTPVPISGTVNAVQSGAWTVAINNYPAVQAVSQSGTWNINAIQSGAWNINATQSGAWSVSVSNFPATQPVSGTVTANQGTSPWTVGGTINSTQSGAWTVGVNNFPSSIPWQTQVALSQVSGTTSVRVFGINPTVGGTDELISQDGIATPYLPTTAVTVEILSNNAADTAAGAGARTVAITGLDINCALVTQTVSLNGVTPVVLPTALRRVTFAQVASVGTANGSNTGTLTIRQNGTATLFMTIRPATSRTFACVYAVPAGYSLIVMDNHVQIESSTSATVKMMSQAGIDTAAAPFSARVTRRSYNQADGQMDWSYDNSPIVIGEKTDVWFAANAAGAPSISTEFIGILRAN